MDKLSSFLVGRNSEKAALEFLLKKKYIFIEQNFKWKRGELDLVFIDPLKKKPELVIVEVRSSAKVNNRYLKFSLGPRKLAYLRRSIEVFLLKKKNFRSYPIRIDVVWVYGEHLFTIEHWTNITI